MLDHITGGRNQVPSDARMRRLAGPDGLLHTAGGIPFAQRREGRNILPVSRLNGLGERVSIPVQASGRRLYFLLSALTFPMDSHVVNARIRVHYSDGRETTLNLVNPDNLDNGWGLFGGTYHYTANRMEVIGEVSPAPAVPAPVTIISQRGPAEELPHEAWESLWYKQPPPDPPIPPHADIVEIECEPGRPIERVDIQALAGDVIVALLGVTLLR